MQQFTLTTVIRASQEKVFHFHDNPDNLVKITPPRFKVTVDSFDNPGPDANVKLTVYPLPLIRTSWHMKITRYEPPDRFEDTMVAGPFQHWVHSRVFSGDGNRTTLTESIEYKLPFGIVGLIVDALIVGPINRRMFTYRQQRIKELLEEGD